MASGPSAICPIHRHAQVRPDALALWAEPRRWTYAELDMAVAATRERLREKGVDRETRVALRMPRGPEHIVLLWALWREGAVTVPLSTRLPAVKAQQAARRSGARLLVTRERSLLRGPTDELETRSPDSFLSTAGRGTPSPTARPIRRSATIVFTSGSTGVPKAVLHSWANHLYSAKGSNVNIPLRSGDRWLLSLPLYHVGGLAILVRCALAGAAVAVSTPDASLSEALHSTGATHVSLVATQLRRLLDATDGPPPDGLRTLLLGGGPLPEPLLRRGHARDWPLHASYGSTEMTSQVTTTPPGAPLNDLFSAGRRLLHRQVRIDNEGQILVSGKTLCTGFVTEEGLVDPRDEGWYPTGDLGRIDAQGRLHVEGRLDRQFVSGGENIQPEEIEAALERLEGVERAVVVAVSNRKYGHRPVGFVRTGTEGLPDGWRAALGTELSRFKVPDALYELPDSAVSNASGMKVDHASLRRRAQEDKRQP